MTTSSFYEKKVQTASKQPKSVTFKNQVKAAENTALFSPSNTFEDKVWQPLDPEAVTLSTPETITDENNPAAIQVKKNLGNALGEICNKLRELKFDEEEDSKNSEDKVIKHIIGHIQKYINNSREESASDILDFASSQIAAMLGRIKYLYGNQEDKAESINSLEKIGNYLSTLLKDLHPINDKIVPEKQIVEEMRILQDQKTCMDSPSFNAFLLKFKLSTMEGKHRYKAPTVFFSHAWPLAGDPLKDSWTEEFLLNLYDHLIRAGVRVLLDKITNNGSKDLLAFMNESINEADHILVICTRTINYKFDNFPALRGSVYEHNRYIHKYRQHITQGKKTPKIIPLCLSKDAAPPGMVSCFHAITAYDENNKYLDIIYYLLGTLYGLGKEFWINLKEEIPSSLLKQKYGEPLAYNEYEEKNSILLRARPIVSSPALERQTIIHNLIHHPSDPSFTGRKTYLDEKTGVLVQSLAENKEAVVVISGPGGIGKSQLANAYAHRAFRDTKQYTLIWWFDAQHEGNLEESYKELAKNLIHNKKLIPDINNHCMALENELKSIEDKPNRNMDSLISKTKEILGLVNISWLLIFDDIYNDKKWIVKYLYILRNINYNQHIIATSRLLILPPILVFKPFQLVSLTRRESIDLIQKILATKSINSKDNSFSLDHLYLLSEALNDFPLALTLAASYLVNNKHGEEIAIGSYLQELDKNASRVWNKHAEQVIENEEVNITWKISLDRIRRQQRNEQAILLLKYMAYLNTVAIPRKFIKKLAEMRSSLLDSLELGKSLDILEAYSLIKKTDDVFSIHPLIQALARRTENNSKLDRVIHFFDYYPLTKRAKDFFSISFFTQKIAQHKKNSQRKATMQIAHPLMKAMLHYIKDEFDKSTPEAYSLLRSAIPHMEKIWECAEDALANSSHDQENALYALYLAILAELMTHTTRPYIVAKNTMEKAIQKMQHFKNDPILELLSLIMSVAYSGLNPIIDTDKKEPYKDENFIALTKAANGDLKTLLSRLIGKKPHEIQGQRFIEAILPIFEEILGKKHPWFFCLELAKGTIYLGQFYIYRAIPLFIANAREFKEKFSSNKNVVIYVDNFYKFAKLLQYRPIRAALIPLEYLQVLLSYTRLDLHSRLTKLLEPHLENIFSEIYEWAKTKDEEAKCSHAIQIVNKVWRFNHIHMARARINMSFVHKKSEKISEQLEELNSARGIFIDYFGEKAEEVLQLNDQIQQAQKKLIDNRDMENKRDSKADSKPSLSNSEHSLFHSKSQSVSHEDTARKTPDQRKSRCQRCIVM